MDISFFNDDGCRYRLRGRRAIRRWLREVARRECGCGVDELNYVFCTSERLLAMNRQWLGHDYYTDIITFDGQRRGEGIISGDIFIDTATVADNARRYGERARREMLRVVVHGVLHLCGQKDKSPRDNRTMHAKEDEYLALAAEMGVE